LIPPCPFEVVQQRPDEVAGEVDAVVDRAPCRVEVTFQIVQSLEIVHTALGVDVVVGRAAVLGDIQRQSRCFAVERPQRVIEALGLDQPAHVGARNVRRHVVDDARIPRERAFALAQVVPVTHAHVVRAVVVEAEKVERRGDPSHVAGFDQLVRREQLGAGSLGV